MTQRILVRKHKQGILLSIKVCPKASIDRIGGIVLDAEGKNLLKVWVRAAPVDDKANQAVIQLFAKDFKLKKKQISVIQGKRDPYKTLLITPLEKLETLETLHAYLQRSVGLLLL